MVSAVCGCCCCSSDCSSWLLSTFVPPPLQFLQVHSFLFLTTSSITSRLSPVQEILWKDWRNLLHLTGAPFLNFCWHLAQFSAFNFMFVSGVLHGLHFQSFHPLILSLSMLLRVSSEHDVEWNDWWHELHFRGTVFVLNFLLHLSQLSASCGPGLLSTSPACMRSRGVMSGSITPISKNTARLSGDGCAEFLLTFLFFFCILVGPAGPVVVRFVASSEASAGSRRTCTWRGALRLVVVPPKGAVEDGVNTFMEGLSTIKKISPLALQNWKTPFLNRWTVKLVKRHQ